MTRYLVRLVRLSTAIVALTPRLYLLVYTLSLSLPYLFCSFLTLPHLFLYYPPSCRVLTPLIMSEKFALPHQVPSSSLHSHTFTKKRRIRVEAFVLGILTIIGVFLGVHQLYPIRLFAHISNHYFLGPIGAPYAPPFLDVHNPSRFQFSVKHVIHQNVDKPLAEASMGRLDISGETLQKLRKDTPLVSFGSEKMSPWDTTYSITPRHDFEIKRLSDRSPAFIQSYIDYANTHRDRGLPAIKSEDMDWIDEVISVPNVTDRDTVVSLAIMASNAYVDIPFTGDWKNVTGDWGNNNTYDFGWRTDGIRGHVFVSAPNDELSTKEGSIVVISIKGTSAAILDNGGDTAPNDKINDNLLFSCCCARISYLWTPVCDCYTGKSYTCNQDCIERELYKKDRYYKAVLEIYNQVQELYPDSEIWVVGHSLGGSLGALLGRTYGLPAVSFEAPGELLPARRMHLPMPPGIPSWKEHIWHFGHTADPIYTGQCNGAASSCSVGGYAMETRCHSGLECVYDVVSDLGWHVSLINHRIHVVIDSVLLAYNTTAECKAPPPCRDCIDWKFVTDNDDDSTEPLPPPPPRSSVTSGLTTEPVTTKTRTLAPPTGPVTTIIPPSDDKDDDGRIEPEPPKVCRRRTWYGRCIDYS